MRLGHLIPFGATGLLFLTAVFAQRQFKEYPGEEVNPAAVPPDAYEKTEWAFARLRYPGFSQPGYGRGWGRRSRWPTDYPKADRQFVLGVRRLTRLHVRSSEQVVDLDIDDDEIYNWPWTYAVEVGHWGLTDAQCRKIRDYLMRGGFLMVDDFHGDREWGVFMASLSRIFPDRQLVEIDSKDPIFHVIYDLDERIQVAGTAALRNGVTYEMGESGRVPHWRGIYDDKGRVIFAACFNQDNGDAWEWADSAEYPEKMASQAYRLGVNYIVYSMTH